MGGQRWVTGKDRITTRVRINPETGCWDWVGGQKTRDGYGRLGGNKTSVYAHRLSYELFRGPIPAAHEVDHLCNRSCCVNPDHLEPVTPEENKRRIAERRTHCKNGHAYTPANTYFRPSASGRDCRACIRARVASYKARRRAS